MRTSPVTIGPCRCHGTHPRDEDHEEGHRDERFRLPTNRLRARTWVDDARVSFSVTVANVGASCNGVLTPPRDLAAVLRLPWVEPREHGPAQRELSRNKNSRVRKDKLTSPSFLIVNDATF